MPAKIIQRNRKPMKKVKVDSVTIDIIESAPVSYTHLTLPTSDLV